MKAEPSKTADRRCPPHSWKLIRGEPGGWRWFCEWCGAWADTLELVVEQMVACCDAMRQRVFVRSYEPDVLYS